MNAQELHSVAVAKTNISSEFLEQVFAYKPDNLWILLWTLSDKESHWFKSVEEASRFAAAFSERDLYVGVGLSPRDFGPHQRCVSDEVAGIVGLWADLDLKSDAHSETALPSTIEDAIQVLPELMPPTFVVQTGNGVHAWWLFREPLIFDSDDERVVAQNLARRWQTFIRANGAARGWALDRLSDLARVLRVPGTRNCKDKANTKAVEIYEQTSNRYNASDFEEFLDDHGIPESEPAIVLNSSAAEIVVDINPSAAVPEDLLARYLTTDPRFHQTWHRQRTDLKDQSQSGYDLALANFGVRAGLSDQQIANLIIHHRRIHCQRQRTRNDYFQRTISRARDREGLGPLNEVLQGQPSSATTSDMTGPAKPRSAIDRALLCQRISAELGIQILRIVKISGKNPTYRVELEATTIQLSSVGKLVEQKSFRMALAAATNVLIPRPKPKVWEQIVQAMLDALTVEDGGEETDPAGSARIHIEDYLCDADFIDSIQGQPRHMQRKPAFIDGCITICSDAFRAYLLTAKRENFTPEEVVSMLAIVGGTSSRVKIAPFRDQTRWFLPVSKFRPDDFQPADGEVRSV